MSKLLLIEDSGPVRSCVSDIVKLDGHELVAASDGTEGIAYAEEQEFDLIISDLHMPGDYSGIELIRELRKRKPTCPIIVVSGYPADGMMDECNELGVRDFLVKPFGISFLSSVINKVLADTDEDLA